MVTSCPSIYTVPASGYSTPAMQLSVVVLPAPEGPTMTRNSPFLHSNETSFSSWTLPKLLLTRSRTSVAIVAHLVVDALCSLGVKEMHIREVRRQADRAANLELDL